MECRFHAGYLDQRKIVQGLQRNRRPKQGTPGVHRRHFAQCEEDNKRTGQAHRMEGFTGDHPRGQWP